LNLEKGDIMALISLKRMNNKSASFRKMWQLLKLGRKAMQIREGNPLSLKLVIMYI
jgi:hypothetical protein